jgi:trk system potassium uptake protein TrkA
MNIIILGAGQVGTTLIQYLCAEHDVTVIDTDPPRLIELQNRFDVRAITGSGAYPHILEEAGAKDADMLIAVTSSDECNIVACQIAYTLFNIPAKIARVRCKELSRYPELFGRDKIAIDTIINPAELVIHRLVRQVEHPGTLMVLDFADGKIQVAAVRVESGSELAGRRLKEIHQELSDTQARVVGVLRADDLMAPESDMQLKAHDELYFCAPSEDINEATQILLGKEIKYRRIMIAGGGNIGLGLAQRLESKYNVKLIEHGDVNCSLAAERLHDAIVLHGDASDSHLLKNENIDETDLFCSVTNDDEANMMSAILAKRLGAKVTIALVNKQTYAHYLIERSPDIDMAISPQRITGGKILTYLRKGDMVNVYSFPRGKAEALEVIVHGEAGRSSVVGKSIEQLRLPSDVVVCAVLRGDKALSATHDLVIENQDHIVLFVCDKKHIKTVEKLFQVDPEYITEYGGQS